MYLHGAYYAGKFVVYAVADTEAGGRPEAHAP